MTDCGGRTKKCNAVDFIFKASKSPFNARNGGTMSRNERDSSKVSAENIIN